MLKAWRIYISSTRDVSAVEPGRLQEWRVSDLMTAVEV